jgi:uncharacterized membrane protein
MIYVVIAVLVILGAALAGTLIYKNNQKKAEAIAAKVQGIANTVKVDAKQAVADVKSAIPEVKK